MPSGEISSLVETVRAALSSSVTGRRIEKAWPILDDDQRAFVGICLSLDDGTFVTVGWRETVEDLGEKEVILEIDGGDALPGLSFRIAVEPKERFMPE